MNFALSLRHFRRPFAGLLAVAGLLLGGCVTRPTEYHEPAPLAASARATLNAEVFDRMWTLVNEHYFDANFRGVDWPAMRARYRPEALAAADDDALYLVLNRMAAELKESHLTAISPRRAHEQRVAARALIGIRWRVIDGQRVVSEVMPGSAAAEAGVQPGWIAVARNGQPLAENDSYVTKLGERVTMEFLDQADEKRVLTLEPRLLNFQRMESRELPGGARYLRFDEFTLAALSWLSRELKTHRDTPGVVLDLRGNPGGNALVLHVAVAEFFEHRVATGTWVKRTGAERPARGLSWFSAEYPGKVVVLTGPASGSAAEILAHVLQHHGRATLIGRKTAGAVILSRQFRLPGGGGVQIPIQDYVGLDGQRLEGRGVKPDVEVAPPTLAEARAATDRELAAALEILSAK